MILIPASGLGTIAWSGLTFQGFRMPGSGPASEAPALFPPTRSGGDLTVALRAFPRLAGLRGAVPLP